MYLRISNDCVVMKSEIVGIFDMDNTTVSRQGKYFLPDAEKNGLVIDVADDLPKSYVVVNSGGGTKVYLSSLSSKVLIGRAKSSGLIT